MASLWLHPSSLRRESLIRKRTARTVWRRRAAGLMLKSTGMREAAGVSTQARIRQTRRRWPLEQNRCVVEATFTPGVSIAQVAREDGVNANQLHSWRRLYQAGRLATQSAPAPLLPVRAVAEPAGTAPPMVTSREPAPHADNPPRGRLHIQGAADP